MNNKSLVSTQEIKGSILSENSNYYHKSVNENHLKASGGTRRFPFICLHS